MRPHGMLRDQLADDLRHDRLGPRIAAVAVTPAHTAFTRTPRVACSIATERDMPITACFDATYAWWAALPASP